MTKKRLAIDGGTPVRNRPFPSWPIWDDHETRNLDRAVRQEGWWRADGREVVEFEREFAAHEGASTAIAVTNGTHALELSLSALGIGPGDEVIIPAQTFVSTASAVHSVGAAAIPVDVDRSTWCLSPEAFAAAITPRTRAVVPVHLAGNVADLDALSAAARSNKIAIVQDAAQAPGARWLDRPIGEFGAVSTYSFQNAKLVAGGEGGAITTNSAELSQRIFRIHNCGRTFEGGYHHSGRASNYRMNEFTAAVLRAQLMRLDELAIRRENNARHLEALLGSVPGVRFQKTDERCTRHARYMFLLEVSAGRDLFVRALNAEGIPATRAYPSVHETETFQAGQPISPGARRRDPCTAADHFARQGIWLHHRLLLDDGGTEEIAEAISKVASALPVEKPTRSKPRRPAGRSDRKCRVGVIGVGWAARQIWLPRLREDPRFEVTALVDVNDDAVASGKLLAPGAQQSTINNLSALDVDLAIVCTPNADHAVSCVSALNQGLHVFVEKPLCVNSAQLREIEKAALPGGLVIMSAAARYRQDVEEFCALVRERAGFVRSVSLSWRRSSGIPAPGSWFTSARACGGALFDLGPHLLDLGFQLTGYEAILDGTAVLYKSDPSTWHSNSAGWRGVASSSPAASYNTDSEVGARGLLSLSGGQAIALDVAWASHRPVDEVHIAVDGEKSSIELHTTFGFSPSRVTTPEITVTADGSVTTRKLPTPLVGEEYDKQLNALAMAIASGNDSDVAGIDAASMVVQGIELLHTSAARSEGTPSHDV